MTKNIFQITFSGTSWSRLDFYSIDIQNNPLSLSLLIRGNSLFGKLKSLIFKVKCSRRKKPTDENAKRLLL